MKTIHELFQEAFQHFNRELFQDQLPQVVFTIRPTRTSYGYFRPTRFVSLDTDVEHHEININLSACKGRSDLEILSTLVHEMTHLQQKEVGKPSSGNYHNKEWVGLMLAVGLIPYATDDPAHKRQTGVRVSHTIEPGGKFELTVGKLLQNHWHVHLLEVVNDPATSKRRAQLRRNKIKYECGCGASRLWGKPGQLVVCSTCDILLSEEEI